MSSLKKKYEEEVKPCLVEKFGYRNPLCVPSLKKIVISMCVSEALKDRAILQSCMKELADISGQKPVLTRAKHSISNFKLRKGQAIGLKVTLRRKRMYDFMYRFVHIVCPRILDFRGFKKRGDGKGNYTLGIKDHQVFPELNLDEVKREQGMHVTFVTDARDPEHGLELLALLGLPFQKRHER